MAKKSRGGAKATHHPSLVDAVKYVLTNNGNKLPFFKISTNFLTIVHSKYNDIAIARGYYKNRAGSRNRSQSLGRILSSTGIIVRQLGYKKVSYNRESIRRDKFDEVLRKGDKYWVPFDWDGLPPSFINKINRHSIKYKSPYYREEE